MAESTLATNGTERKTTIGKKVFIDRTGMTFGRLTVVGFAGFRRRMRPYWHCRCACGAEKDVCGESLVGGDTRSCGCLKLEGLSKRTTTHGQASQRRRTREYKCWGCMISRCTNPNDTGYKNYGGRGITVCDRWLNSFENFFSDMGTCPPKHTIERRDNSKGYDSDNCCWSTKKEQCRNTRHNRYLTFLGETRCVSEWAEILGISQKTLTARLNRGWSDEKTVATPLSIVPRHGQRKVDGNLLCSGARSGVAERHPGASPR